MEQLKSWRPAAFAKRHSVSVRFIYKAIEDGRLNARKPAPGVTIITDDDEAAWLAAMPVLNASDDTEAA